NSHRLGALVSGGPGHSAPLQHFFRRKWARQATPLDLQRCMGDAKFAGERLGNLLNFFVATVVVGHHQMSREGGFGRAEWPDVKVMNLGDLRPRLEKGLHLLWINRSR